jgi:hypothetical protein
MVKQNNFKKLNLLFILLSFSLCGMERDNIIGLLVTNKLNVKIFVQIVPLGEEVADYYAMVSPVLDKSKLIPAAIPTADKKRSITVSHLVKTIAGASAYRVSIGMVGDNGQRQVKIFYTGPIVDNQKIEVLMGKDEKITLAGASMVELTPEWFANAATREAKAMQEYAPTAHIIQKILSKHPQWFSELEKINPRYWQAVPYFCCDKFAEQDPIKAYDKFQEFYENQLRTRMPGVTDSLVARLLAIGAISFSNQKKYNIGEILWANKAKNQLLINLMSGAALETPLKDPKLYKIHLMPRDEDIIKIFDALERLIFNDSTLRIAINYFKIMSADSEFLEADRAPRIVVYIFSTKEGDAAMRSCQVRAQTALNKIYAAFKDVPGSGLVPGYNIKVTDLIYFTQGNRQDKVVENAEDMFDPQEGLVYFRPGYKGYAVDFHLRLPQP